MRLSADARGHFVVEAEINRRPVTLVADTGAMLVVLSYEDAERLGLSPKSLDFLGIGQTANGTARVTPLTLAEVRLGDTSRCAMSLPRSPSEARFPSTSWA